MVRLENIGHGHTVNQATEHAHLVGSHPADAMAGNFGARTMLPPPQIITTWQPASMTFLTSAAKKEAISGSTPNSYLPDSCSPDSLRRTLYISAHH